MRTIFYIAALLLGYGAHAQLSNLPDLAGSTQIGRVTLYASVQPLSWLQPTAFTPEFMCTSTGDMRSCTIRIYNRLTPDEDAQINQLAQSQGLGVVPMGAIDTQVVNGVREEFRGLPQDLTGQTMSMGTLQMTEGNYLYASFAFRVKTARATELTQQFQNDGLGSYFVQFQVNAQRTETYMGFRNGTCVRDQLNSIRSGSARSDVNAVLGRIVATCGLKYFNFEKSEAESYALIQLRNTFLIYSWLHGYSVNPKEIEKVGKVYELNNSTTSNLALACQSEVKLQAGAQVKTVCQPMGR